MTDKIVTLSKKLMLIQSETRNSEACREVLDIIKHELAEFSCTPYVSNGITSLLFSNKAIQQRHFKLILNAHVDVVRGEIEQFQPFIKDGKLYGRGAIDMKTAAAAMIVLFKELATKVTYPLGLQIVTDEERGGENGAKYQIEQGIRADFVLGGEHSGLRINNEAKGVYYIKLQANGTAAHSAYPWNGKNASFIMMQTIHKLHELLPLPEKEVWESTASIIKIETDNNTVNTIPHICTAYVNIRYIPEEKRDLIKELKNMLPEEVSLEILLDVPPEYTPRNNAFVKTLTDIIEKTTGKPAEFLKTHGQSDLRYYHMIGIPAVNFSPIGDNHHAKDEWVDLESLKMYAKTLKDFLEKI